MLVDDLVVMAAFGPTDSLNVDVLPPVAKGTTVIRPIEALYSVLNDSDKGTDEYETISRVRKALQIVARKGFLMAPA